MTANETSNLYCMKRLLTLTLCLLCLSIYAQVAPNADPQTARKVYTPQNLPNIHLQNKYRYLCDPEGIISPVATDSIDRMLYQLEQQTGIETVVAVVPSIGQTECFDFCHELLNSWGVGKKGKDNGLVILLVTDQRCIQFYTGYGLEGPLPDAICKRIQTQEMIPYLRDGRWSEGMMAGIRATCARLDGSMENDSPTDEEGELGTALAIILAFILFGIAIVIVTVRRATRCPHCKKHALQRIDSQTISIRNGVKTEEVTYICRNCGHVVKRHEHHEQGNNRGRGGGGWGGPVIFGGGGGLFGGGGGGFSGGSFGGGSGGGGGAGSRF